MKPLALSLLAAIVLSGCATEPTSLSIYNDPRVGTDQTPYRSIAPVLLCDDCRYGEGSERRTTRLSRPDQQR